MRFGEEGFEGLLPSRRLRGWWTLQRARHGARARGLGPRAAPRRPGRGDGRPGRDRRAGGSTCRPPMHTRRLGWRRSASAKPPPATWRRTARRAFRYNLLERFEAGIVLQGSEVKSLRNGVGAAEGRLRRGARRRGLAAQHAHRALRARPREPRPRAPAQAAAAPARDRAADRQDRREGPDDRADARLLQRARARRSRSRWRRGKDVHDKRRAIKERDERREIDRALSER